MKNIDIYSLIIPVSLITFTMDYLPDNQIVKDETTIGFYSYLHHLISIICTIGLPAFLLFSKSLFFVTINIIIFIIAQIGWLYNKDYCWLTKKVNTTIDSKKPNRIWRADINSFIKHYIRGDSWAYKDIYNNDKTNLTLFVNIILLIHLIKINTFN
jgi:hypothetical protein